MWDLGDSYHYGELGLEKDMMRAIEQYGRAAELGVKEARFKLRFLYDEGTDVGRDTANAIRHYEAAAMRGRDDGSGERVLIGMLQTWTTTTKVLQHVAVLSCGRWLGINIRRSLISQTMQYPYRLVQGEGFISQHRIRAREMTRNRPPRTYLFLVSARLKEAIEMVLCFREVWWSSTSLD